MNLTVVWVSLWCLVQRYRKAAVYSLQSSRLMYVYVCVWWSDEKNIIYITPAFSYSNYKEHGGVAKLLRMRSCAIWSSYGVYQVKSITFNQIVFF